MGEALFVEQFKNDEQGLKRGSAGPPAKPIIGRLRLLSASKLTLRKLSLKAKVYNTIWRKGQPFKE